MTKKQYNNILSEISELKKQLEKAKERLAIGKKAGDLRENSEVDQASLDIQILEKQIKNKEAHLRDVEITEDSDKSYTFLLDGKKMVMSLGQVDRNNYFTALSENSPVGDLLKKHDIGDVFSYLDLNGTKHTIEILKIV